MDQLDRLAGSISGQASVAIVAFVRARRAFAMR